LETGASFRVGEKHEPPASLDAVNDGDEWIYDRCVGTFDKQPAMAIEADAPERVVGKVNESCVGDFGACHDLEPDACCVDLAPGVGGANGELVQVVAIAVVYMGSRCHHGDASLGGPPCHRQRSVPVGRPIVNGGEQVRVKVVHRRTSAASSAVRTGGA
jgi:hypothetical protein